MKRSLVRLQLFVVIFAACLCLRPAMFAQQPVPVRPEQNAPANASPKPTDASGEETAQLKHSASVRLLARITGMSVEDAYWLAVVINFAIVVAGIVWVWKKFVPALFRNRTSSIQKALEEARRASQDANQRLADIESRLGRLGDEIAEMRTMSEREAAAEEERIKTAAEDDARRIVQSAEQEIAAAAKAARRELTTYAADLAVSLAARQIHVDAPTDQALVRRFASQLPRDGGNGKKA